MNASAILGRRLEINDPDYPGLHFFLIFFAFLFAIMWYLLGCGPRPVIPA